MHITPIGHYVRYGLPGALLLAGWLCGCGGERARVLQQEPDSEDKDYREMLERSRGRRAADADMAKISEALSKFQSHVGRTPTNLLELVRYNYLDSIPPAPEGTQFFYDDTRGNIRLVRDPAAGAVAR